MGELVGDGAYLKYGDEFPLLVKFIDTTDRTSVQVHPGDEMAAREHGAYGKDEMWYVLGADDGAEIMVGFASAADPLSTTTGGAGGLNRIKVRAGDAFFIPAGTVHSIGGGVSLVEVQQTSDVTYRIYDWERTEEDGTPRELHTGLAAEAMDAAAQVRRINLRAERNEAALLVEGGHFTVNLIDIGGSVERDASARDGFTVYVCTAGIVEVGTVGGSVVLAERGTVLVPADQPVVTLAGEGTVLEAYL